MFATLSRLWEMGCVCGKESVKINNRRFHVKTRLGEGGFSYVDLVVDAQSRKSFALKRIICHGKDDEKVALQELEYMRQLDHPNLVPLEDGCQVALNDPTRTAISQVLIVMPYCRKGTLQDEINVAAKTNGRIPEHRILMLTRGVCEGLRALHSLHPTPLAHRDIKPANVLMTNDDMPMLMDFGSMAPAQVEVKGSAQARQLQDIAAERCTMPYRAPELFNVESYCIIDERIDIWSLGCLLYALCYLESPYEKDYQRGGSIALAVLSGNIRYPDHPTYSADMQSLISALLVVNPVERPYIDWVIDRVDGLISMAENRI